MKDLQLSALFKTKQSSDSSDDSLIITGMANTTAKDRAGDVILASAWTTSNALKNYMKNPIILAFHDHKLPIGKAISIAPTPEGLLLEVEISKAAGAVYDLIKTGILKAFSVGFRCLDAEWDEDTDTFVIKDVELHEVSVVSVPCNQDSTFAVAKSLNAHDFSEFKKKVAPKAPTPERDLLEKLALELGIIEE